MSSLSQITLAQKRLLDIANRKDLTTQDPLMCELMIASVYGQLAIAEALRELDTNVTNEVYRNRDSVSYLMLSEVRHLRRDLGLSGRVIESVLDEIAKTITAIELKIGDVVDRIYRFLSRFGL